MNASAILDVRRLTKSYRTNSGELTILKDISFVLGPGATCSILGPSGSGKTTLLGLCAGLDLPTSGHVCLNGIALDEIGEDERARVRNQLVGFVFQSFQLIPTLTALENVTVPMELRGDRRARQQGLELLERVGLAGRVSHLPSQLSGGEQQRVAIARALANDPDVLLADEPTGNLDSATGEEIVGLLRELWSDGLSVVLITHDLDVAATAPRVIRMQDGKLLAQLDLA